MCGDTTSDINALKLLNEAVGARAGLRDAGPLLHRELSGMNLSRFVNASDRIAGRGRCFFLSLRSCHIVGALIKRTFRSVPVGFFR